MNKKSPVRNIFSVIIGVLLGLILLFGIIWVPIQKVLMQPDAYKQASQDQGLYRVYPILISGVLSGDSSSNILGDGLGQLTSKLDQDRLNDFIFSMVPPEWFQEQVDLNLDRVFGFLHGSEDTLSLGVDLNGFKNNLGQENSVRGVIQLLPVCTTADLAGLLSLLGGEKNLPLCRFPDEVMGLVFPVIQPFILNMVSQIPDQIPLITLSLQSPNTPPGLVTFVNLVRNSNTISGILIGLNILLLTALVLVSTPGWKIKIRNCGIVFLAAGTAGLVLDFIFWLGINSGTNGVITSATSAFPADIGEVITGIYLQIANSFVMVASLAGFIVLTSGVILFVISRTILKSQSDS
jgi:hypothetical protein